MSALHEQHVENMWHRTSCGPRGVAGNVCSLDLPGQLFFKYSYRRTCCTPLGATSTVVELQPTVLRWRGNRSPQMQESGCWMLSGTGYVRYSCVHVDKHQQTTVRAGVPPGTSRKVPSSHAATGDSYGLTLRRSTYELVVFRRYLLQLVREIRNRTRG